MRSERVRDGIVKAHVARTSRSSTKSAADDRPRVYVEDGASSFIENVGLGPVVDGVVRAVARLQRNNAPITKIVIEHEVDPEIDERELLAVTVWAQGAPPDAALALWRALFAHVEQELGGLPQAEQEKFRQHVSLGVDVE